MNQPHTINSRIGIAVVIATIFTLLACGGTSSIAAAPTATHAPTVTLVPPTATPVPPTATLVPPTATPAPSPGVCNAADFPTKTNGGPDGGFTYPPLTYYYDVGPAAGNNYFHLCSSGDASSILATFKSQFPTGGWTVTNVTATTLGIEKPQSPPTGFCFTEVYTFGGHAGYPGEWDLDSHPPAASC